MRAASLETKGLLLALLWAVPLQLLGQPITFRKVHGGVEKDEAYDLLRTADQGYIVTGGSANYSPHDGQGFLFKFDSLGDPLWQKAYGGSGTERFHSLVRTADSNLVMGGVSNSGSQGDYGFYLVKTETNGDTLWSRRYGGNDWDLLSSLLPLPDSTLLAGGNSYSYGQGASDILLLKLDRNGDTLWSRTYGDVGIDELHDIARAGSNEFVLVGSTTDSVSSDTVRARMIRIDSVGVPIQDCTWTLGYFAQISSVVGTSGGETVLLINKRDSSDGDIDVALQKRAADGSMIWARALPQAERDHGSELIRTPDGGFLFSGFTEAYGNGKEDIWLFKTDPAGFYEWGNTYGGSDRDVTHSLISTSDTGFVTAGITESFGNSQKNIYLIRTDSLGTYTGNIVVGLEENKERIKEGRLSIFPNPLDQEEPLRIRYRASGRKELRMRIRDLQGRVVHERMIEASSSTQRIHLPKGQKAGLYLVEFLQEGQHLSTEKLIVR